MIKRYSKISNYFITLLFCLAILKGYGQIIGTVRNSSSLKPVSNISVHALNSIDSSFMFSGKTDVNGRFCLNLKADTVLLFINSVNHELLYKLVSNISAKNDLTLFVKDKSILLDEVVIDRPQEVIIKGDTVIYDAKAYKLPVGTTVEGFLKKIPGIEISKDGAIIAQGKKVDRLLVDGEEFFSDDPTIATRNLKHEYLDKVKIYDKGNRISELTSVEDNKKARTIDLILKEEYKNNSFGILEGGTDLKKFYQYKGMYNILRGKRRVSLYSYGGNNAEYSASILKGPDFGNTNLTGEIQNDKDLLSQSAKNISYNGEGIPRIISVNANYNDIYKEKNPFDFSYAFNDFDLNVENNSIIQRFLTGNIVNQLTSSDDRSRNRTHVARLNYEYHIDSLNKVLFNSRLRKGSGSHYSLKKNKIDILNKSDYSQKSETNSENNEGYLQTGISYIRMFKREKRSLVVSGFLDIDDEKFNSYRDLNEFDGENNLHTMLNSNSQSKERKLSLSLRYNEPLLKNFILSTSYVKGFSKIENTFHIESPIIKERASVRQNIDAILLGLDYRIKNLVLIASLLTENSRTDISNTNGIDTIDKRWLLNPSIRAGIFLGSNNVISIDYNGSNQTPSLYKRINIPLNLDPLNSFVGNPNINPAYKHDINLVYRVSLIKRNIFLFTMLNFNNTSNPIITNTFTDGEGKNTIGYTNKIGESYNNLYSSFSIEKWNRKKELKYGISFAINRNSGGSINNNVYSDFSGTTLSISPKFSFQRNNFDFSFAPEISRNEYRNNSYSVNNVFSKLVLQGNLSFTLPFKILFSTDVNYYVQEANSYNPKIERAFLKGSISRRILKKQNLNISLNVNDIFNELNNFERSSYDNILIQRSFTTIPRYYMLKMSFDLNKNTKL